MIRREQEVTQRVGQLELRPFGVSLESVVGKDPPCRKGQNLVLASGPKCRVSERPVVWPADVRKNIQDVAPDAVPPGCRRVNRSVDAQDKVLLDCWPECDRGRADR